MLTHYRLFQFCAYTFDRSAVMHGNGGMYALPHTSEVDLGFAKDHYKYCKNLWTTLTITKTTPPMFKNGDDSQ